MKRWTVYFILVNLVFSAFYLDTWHNANPTSRVVSVLSMANEGSLKIDSLASQTIDKSIVNGHYYSDKAPLPAFVVVGFYAVLKVIGLVHKSVDFDSYSKPVFLLGSLICGSIPFVLICYIFFKYAAKNTNNKWAATLTLLFLYTSFVFIFSGTFFAHVFSAALLLLSYITIKERKYFYSGLFLGLAFLSDFTIVFILPIWAVQVFINEKNFKSLLLFAGGIVPSVLLLLIYNAVTAGSPFDLLYNHPALEDFANVNNLGFSFPSIRALYGLTISPYRGMLIYCPMLLLALFYYFKSKPKLIEGLKTNYLLFIAIGYFFLISAHAVWWGGWSYGPRQLMPVAVLILFEAVLFISKQEINKKLFWICSSLLLLFTWLVKSTVAYSVPTEIKNPFKDYFFQNFLNGLSNSNNVLTIVMGFPPALAAVIWLFLFVSVLVLLNPKQKLT